MPSENPLNIATRKFPELPFTASSVLMDVSIFNSDLRICSRRLKLNEGYHLLSHRVGKAAFSKSVLNYIIKLSKHIWS